MAPPFELAARLRADCHVLGRLPLSHVLLLDKREVPWFILVPETAVIELCDLDADEQAQLQREVNAISRLLRARFTVTKLNVAAIGNIVSQLHVHVIGRHAGDPWWPNVAWGQASAGGYTAAEVSAIAQCVASELGADYRSL
ncbi:MAG: HIT family protein [Proteobacteria bacterium]|nr:HIT family protein [Pseudomonadota bacterium]